MINISIKRFFTVILYILFVVNTYAVLVMYVNKNIADIFLISSMIFPALFVKLSLYEYDYDINFTKEEFGILKKTGDYLVKKYGLISVEKGFFIEEGVLKENNDKFSVIYKDVKNHRRIMIMYDKKTGKIEEKIYDGSKDSILK